MSEQHEVTVYDRVPATARVSVEQVERYLRRAGRRWSCDSYNTRIWVRLDESYERENGAHPAIAMHLDGGPSELTQIVQQTAAYENRLPSAVLADIAKEPA
jgi:hypothetical protein